LETQKHNRHFFNKQTHTEGHTRTGRGDASRYFMLPADVSNRAYDTEPYHVTIEIYAFDIFNNGVKTQDTILLKGVKMDTAKRKAHQRAKELGFKVDGAWCEACSTYSSRKYRTIAGARRLIVLERS